MERSRFDRRAFLKSSVLGATGLIAGQDAFAGTPDRSRRPRQEEPKIIFRTLGKTGLKLPIVSMGVMNSDNPNLVRAALDKGITHLDTAHTYQRGRNETMLGEVLKDYPRDSYTIATKIHPVGQDRRTGLYNAGEFTQDSYMEMFNLSLERLGLDHVDILFHHGVSGLEGMFFEPVVDIMNKIKRSGRARFIGVSTHSNEAAVLAAAAECGFLDVVLTSYNFTLNIEEMNAAIDKAADAGLGIIAMKTMAGGYLDRQRERPVKAQAALKWALQNPKVHTSIPGFTTFDQLEESFAIMANPGLTEEERRYIEENRQQAFLFCAGCQNCLNQCGKNLPIPDIMRAYMYTYGYGNLEKAYRLLSDLDLPNNPCRGCGTCTVACTKNFDVASRIIDVSRLVDVPEEFLIWTR